ncbi:3-hydroxybutyryl-CoA dehydrogenase [Bordetella trematum]|uniref:3-hydroxybutyryl-CoA dehydrogenase n=1 Tax=Bordetella trematum TaxID=123899 RepID=A0A157RB80_9BORD|nr:3-hydroxyacyl-CoA dehydrogenase family protein [Bordetella trematum]AUL48994.1 3-hydroxybutyryl-CoA dehydrogenase [Bordetella trematum]AZR95937.1 3-hydroxybutyryl-CoA dehydrogenase [Bordetella trematum]NNH19608.1 3-hydroxyacyl-CoA dehydrogenase family protein [Bordetella trematum]QIM71210.1 3-hydroxyacyl-CoA dehydrogenase family protein [Bordetella trematum]SAI55260.1 3-hydroxybutyryl-CoA dehydrogenase [Bordetella trematum]
MAFPIQTLAVIGAGSMGSGIAALFASQGLPVVLVDPVDGALDRARAIIERQLQVYAPQDAPASLARITMRPDLAAAADCDLVIEAVPENLALKRKLFAELDGLCKAEAVFATNTSGLSINAIAEAVTRRDRFVGTHFFTPADVIPLVEVVCGDQTTDASVELVMAVLKAAGKRPVRVNQDIPGFIANRIQHALAREAISLLEKGVASAEDIDEVVKWSLGIRLALSGPLEQRDMNGIDVHHAIASYLYADLENRQTPSDLLTQKVESGAIGAKAGQGFYTWEPERRERVLREKSAALAGLVAWLKTQKLD